MCVCVCVCICVYLCVCVCKCVCVRVCVYERMDFLKLFQSFFDFDFFLIFFFHRWAITSVCIQYLMLKSVRSQKDEKPSSKSSKFDSITLFLSFVFLVALD